MAEDGMRVRASAGAASFRGAQGLKKCMEEARAQVERLAQERERPDPGVTRRERAARERAAREREERVREALSYLPRAQAKKERQLHTKATDQRPKVTKARVSTTDPQATVMKMPDGGFRPACNIELATDSANGVSASQAESRGFESPLPLQKLYASELRAGCGKVASTDGLNYEWTNAQVRLHGVSQFNVRQNGPQPGSS